jgi:hypothetical protein
MGRSKAATIAAHWFLSTVGVPMQSNPIFDGNVAVHEGADARDTLAEFKRTDEELTFEELLAGKFSVDLSGPMLQIGLFGAPIR